MEIKLIHIKIIFNNIKILKIIIIYNLLKISRNHSH